MPPPFPPRLSSDPPDAPTSAITGEDTAAVEVGNDLLDAHLAGRAIAFQSEAINQPHRVGVQRVDLQLLLDLRAALLGSDGAIADRRKRAVPEALPGILFQGSHDVLGIFLGLIFIEQRHDLPHHDVHGVIPHFLRSEEHTSELQSLMRISYAVFCLKKKKKNNTTNTK